MRVGGALVALFVAALSFQVFRPHDERAPRFDPVAKDVYRLTQWLQPVPGLLSVPISVFMVRQGSSWALVDAGVPGTARQPFARWLLEAVQSTIPAGDKLALIALTHGHPDHTGALPLLLDAYPDVPVAYYEDEKPMLDGSKPFAPPGSLKDRLMKAAGVLPEQQVTVPPERTQLLEEVMGNFADFGLDDLAYFVTTGHTPGHISLLHDTTRTILAGDAFTFLKPALALAATAEGNDTRVVRTVKPLPSAPGLQLRAAPFLLCTAPECDRHKAEVALCMLADAMEYKVIIASHDYAAAAPGIGWTQAELRAHADTLPYCLKLRKEAAEDYERRYGTGGTDADGDADVDEEEDEYEPVDGDGGDPSLQGAEA